MQYYAFFDGQKHGPFTLEQLAAQQLPADAKIWRKGLSSWLSPNDVPELQGQIQTMPPPDPVPANPPARPAVQTQSRSGGATASPAVAFAAAPTVDKAKGVLTNLQLPSMANWICVYAIIVSPLLWMFWNASCLASLPSKNVAVPADGLSLLLEFVGVFVNLAATVILVIGGLRLRDLRLSGVKFLKIGLWVSLGWSAVELVVGLPLAMMGSESESNPAEMVLLAFQLPLGLAALVFEIVAIIWLYKHSKELPLAQP